MKCLEKDRARRYETANGLASDLQRHLDQEPVNACPPSNFYRFQKLVWRNKLAFAAAGAVAASLLMGLGISTWMFFQERAAKQEQARLRLQAQANEQKAQTEAAKSDQVAGFLEEMLQGVGPSVALGRDTTILREIMEKAAARVGTELTNQPEVEIDLRALIGKVYGELGDTAKAEAMHRQAVAIARKVYGSSDPNLAWLFVMLADTLNHEHRPEEGERAVREAMAIFRQQPDGEDKEKGMAQALERLGTMLRSQRKLEESEQAYRESLERKRKIYGNDSLEFAAALNALANDVRETGKPAEAEAMLRESLEIRRRNRVSENDPSVAITLHNLAVTFQREGKLAEAEEACRGCLAIWKKLVGDRPDVHLDLNMGVLSHLGYLADILTKEGKLEEAAKLRSEGLAHLQNTAEVLARQIQPQNPDLLSARGQVFARLGRWKEAVADLTRVRELRPQDYFAWAELAAVLVQAGDVAAYREHCRKSVELFGNTTDPKVADGIAKACLTLPSSGTDPAAVGKMADTAVARGQTDYMTWFEFCKGLAEYRQGHFSAAAEWTQKVLSRSGDPHAPVPMFAGTADVPERDVEAYAVLAMARYQMKQTNQARVSLAKGLELADQKLPKLAIADLGSDWKDWIIGHALLREAKAPIEGSDASDDTK